MVAQLYNQKRGISEGNSLLGLYNWRSGDLDKALVHFDRAMRLSNETLNDLWDFVMLADDRQNLISFDKPLKNEKLNK